MKFLGILVSFTTLLVANVVAGKENEVLERILENYNPSVGPLETNGTDTGPVIVSVSFFVENIHYIDEKKMEYAVELTFKQEWKDQRLALKYPDYGIRSISLKDPTRIWLPDLYFTNERSGRVHDLLTPNKDIRISPEGDVRYRTRIYLRLACPMTFLKFPFDSQVCSIKISSFSSTKDELIFRWKKHSPIQVTPDLFLSVYTLEQFKTTLCGDATDSDLNSCLQADFLFKRQFYYYFIQIYIPCTSLVIMSYLSLWLNRKETVGHLLISLITFSVMTMAIFYLNGNLPIVNTTKAVDVWTGVCLTFASISIWEFVLIHFLMSGESSATTGKANKEQEVQQHGRNFFKCIWNCVAGQGQTSGKVDNLTRILYPIGFMQASTSVQKTMLLNFELFLKKFDSSRSTEAWQG